MWTHRKHYITFVYSTHPGNNDDQQSQLSLSISHWIRIKHILQMICRIDHLLSSHASSIRWWSMMMVFLLFSNLLWCIINLGLAPLWKKHFFPRLIRGVHTPHIDRFWGVNFQKIYINIDWVEALIPRKSWVGLGSYRISNFVLFQRDSFVVGI